MTAKIFSFPILKRSARPLTDGCLALAPEAHYAPAPTRPAKTRLKIHPTILEYNDEGSVLRVTDASGTRHYQYDEFQNLTAEQDQLGRITRHVYNDQDRRISTTDPLGNVTRYEYHIFGGITKTTLPNGVTTENAMDNFGNVLQNRNASGDVTTFEYHPNLVGGVEMPGRGPLKSVTDPMGNVTTYPRYEGGQPLSMRDALGHLTLYEYSRNLELVREIEDVTGATGAQEQRLTVFAYDNSGRPTSTTHPDGSITSIEYNERGLEKARIDGRGNRTEFFYNDRGLLETIKNPDGTTRTFSYDAEGHRTSVRNEANQQTTFAFDPAGRLTTTTFAGSPTAFTRNIYDSASQIVSAIDANNNPTTYDYDSAGRRIRVTDALGFAKGYSFDSVGNLVLARDENGNATSYEYDSASRQIRVIYPDSTVMETAHDSMGRTVLVRDQNGNEVITRFDALGRLVSRIDDLGHEEKFEYNEAGEIVAYIDKSGDRIAFEVDKMGRRTKATLPGGQVYRWTHDEAGNIATYTDPKGFVTAYEYDQFNRQTRVDFDPRLSDADIVRTYTTTGKPKTIERAIDGQPWVIGYEYNDRDLRARMTTPVDDIDYTYDNNSNLLTTTSRRKGLLVTYRHNALNLLKEAEDAQGRVTKFTYEPNRNLKTVEYPNGVKLTVTYDPLNRPLIISWTAPSGEIVRQQFVLDDVGNRLTNSEIGMSRTWTYDDIYRLTSEQVYDPALPNQGGVIGNAYDFDRNRVQRNSTVTGIPSQSFTFNGNDEIAGQTFDLNGNPATAGSASGLQYSALNELVSANGGQVKFGYDGLGQRVKRTANGVTTWSLWDDLNPTGYAQVLIEYEGANASTATPKTVYTYGHRIISQRDEQSGATSWFVGDAIGSTRALTDEGGQVVARYEYEAHGNILRQSGPRTTNMLYVGENRDPDLGLDYFRARFYDPGTGRFLQRDPIFFDQPGELAAFAYADNNAVMNTDPTGQFTLAEVTISTAISFTLSSIAVNALFEAPGIASDVAAGRDLDLVAQEAGAAIALGLALDVATLGGAKLFKAAKFAKALNSMGQAGELALRKLATGSPRVFRPTSKGARFIDWLTDAGVAMESKQGYVSLTSRIRSQIAKDAELLADPTSGVTRVEWHFYPGKTGTGPTAPLKAELQSRGIAVVEHEAF